MQFALAHITTIQQHTQTICASRDAMLPTLAALPQLQVFPSQTNFILLRCRTMTADMLFQRFLDAGILVKNLHGAHPLTQQCLRISIGTAEENQQVIHTIKQAVAHA